MSYDHSGKLPNRTGSVHKAVAASIFIALLIAGFILVQKNSPAGIAAVQEQNKQELADLAQKSARELLSSVSSTGKDRTDEEIDAFIAKHSPARLTAVIAYLRSDNTSPAMRFIAAEVGERAGKRYQNSNLLLAAVSEYISGINVQKDFVHAKDLLDIPLLQQDIRTDYYLGLWWSDKSNKEMDVATARKYFKKAADAGFTPALKALQKI